MLKNITLSLLKMSQCFYAVGVGRKVGVYNTWSECQEQVSNISNAKFRKFTTQKEAIAFIQECKEKHSPYNSPSKNPLRIETVSLTQPSSSLLQLSAFLHASSVSSSSQPVSCYQTDRSLKNLYNSPSSTDGTMSSKTLCKGGNFSSTSCDSERLSPETLAAIANLSDDPFPEEVMPNTSSQASNLNESNAMKELMKKMDKYFMDIKSTLGYMMVKIHDLDTKVEALTNHCVEGTGQRNSALSVGDTNHTVSVESSARPSVRKDLLANYSEPQPVGKRQKSTSTSIENDVEIVPVPPKKIPKVELNSDDEVDGFDYDFKVNEEGFVVVFTDGACENNGKRGAKAGIGVWFGDSHPLNCSQPVRGRPTNNTAEIQAAVLALEVAKRAGVKKILVHTDSEFLINCITKWVKKWQKNGWKVASGNPVKNKEDLELLMDAMNGINVKWVHVRGHQGIHGNEMADRLARSGAEKYKS